MATLHTPLRLQRTLAPFSAQKPGRQPRRLAAVCSAVQGEEQAGSRGSGRRSLLAAAAGAAVVAAGGLAPPAQALPGFKKDLTNKRRLTVPEADYLDGPEGVRFYDMTVGTGAEAKLGQRVVIHYECKWKGVTVVTSRQGMGVTGGTPLGFDVGAEGAGGTLKGLDLGVRGMRVGGRRKLKVPPKLAYGEKGIGEIPGNAVLDFDVELLSIKTNAIGVRVKLVEG